MKIKITIILLAAVLVFNMTAFKSMAAADGSTSFDLLSGSSRVAAGDSFTVTVAGKGLRDMYACEVRLTFDNSLLKYAGIASDIRGYKILPEADQVKDKIIFAVAKQGDQLPESGDAALCTITFTGIKEGNARVTLNTVKLMDEILRSADYSMEKTIVIPIGDADGGSVTASPATTPTTTGGTTATATPASTPAPIPTPTATPVSPPASTPTPTATPVSPLAPAPTPTATPRPTPTPVQIINILPELIPLDTATGIARIDLGEQAEGIFSREGVSVVNAPLISGAEAYTLGLPADSLSGVLGGGLLSFSTEMGSVTVPGNMLEGTMEAVGKYIGITIGIGDKTGLPDDLKETLGDRPLVQLTLTLDGVQVGWDNPRAPVTVSVPYTPTVEELANPEHIVVWYIDGDGKAVPVPNGRYDLGTGMVTFTVNHFSLYAVAYVYRSFGDLDSVAWAKKAIEIMVSKGIIAGTGGNTYSPASSITRADYLKLLVSTLGLWAEAEDNFEDVKPNAYYYEAVGIAKKLGITNGVENNRFNPKDSISRQDMIVLTARALMKYKGLKISDDTGVLDTFTDRADIAGYAVESVATLVKEGLIAGTSNNRLNSRSWVTRAEAAVFLYRIYKH